ncbi:hypothetical protein MMC17_010073 [Xylographa soralifera]|nr:hypothetical protein [Xylographa soralifera]
MAGKLHPQLLKALDVMGFKYMTPVQSKVLSELPSFRTDCLVQAKTGTGKTAAFLLPALHSLLVSDPLPTAHVGILIISPTRELALQIAKECDQLTSQLSKPIECHTAFGDLTARATNLNRFMNGLPSVLVATPGRLKDYLSDGRVAAKLRGVRTVILDEADTMLESGFLADVTEILKLLPPKASGWQGMCFSATIPAKIKDVINIVLRPGYKSLSTIDKNEPPTIAKVPQYYVLIPSVKDTFTTLASLLALESKTSSKIVVFGVTANMVALYARLFEQALTHLKVYELHSRLSQNIRTRTTDEFKAAESGLMFASDVIGRGMDFPNVDLVIQVGLPSNGEQYVHRVGRTARAGNDGRAVIILTQAESFFLDRNPQLPIQLHGETPQILNHAANCAPMIEQAMYQIDEIVKQRAYSSFLGFFAGSGFLKPLHMDKVDLVQMANEMAVKGMYCPEPPPMEKKTIGKMGLKGVPGFTYASGNIADDGSGFANSRSRPSGRGGRGVLKPQDAGAVKKQAGGRGGGGQGAGGGGIGGGRGGGVAVGRGGGESRGGRSARGRGSVGRGATARAPPTLPPTVEEAYRKKCIELKRRMNEVEENNDAYRLRKTRLVRGIRKMRLERAILLETLGKRMRKHGGDGTNGMYDDESEASSEGPPTPQEKPLRSKRGHRRPAPSPRSASTHRPLHPLPTPSHLLPHASFSTPIAPHPGPNSFLHANGSTSNPLRVDQSGMYAHPPPNGFTPPSQQLLVLPPQPPRPLLPTELFISHMITVELPTNPQNHPANLPEEEMAPYALNCWQRLAPQDREQWERRYDELMQVYGHEMRGWEDMVRGMGVQLRGGEADDEEDEGEDVKMEEAGERESGGFTAVNS